MVVRANVASSLECLHWERRLEGVDKRRIWYSRCMVGKVKLDKSVGHFGKEICIMAVHMHNKLANNIWPDKLTEFWAWCHKLCVKHSVDVLMGDFSMALFRVIPELRSRGSTIDLAAWYPWKSSVGEPCADSCAIFCLQKPGLYKLEVGLQNLHADDEDGILALCTFGWERAETAVAGEENGDQAIPFHIHDREGGPGQSLYRYLRTTDGLPEQFALL